MGFLSPVFAVISYIRNILTKHRMSIRIVIAVMGMFVTISACVVFRVLGNLDAATWSGFSAVLATFVLYLHVIVFRDEQRQKLQAFHFNVLVILGVLGFVIGLVAFIVYIILGKHHKEQGFSAQGNYVVCVWNFTMLAWGFALLYYANRYRREYWESEGETTTTNIVIHNEVTEVSDYV